MRPWARASHAPSSSAGHSSRPPPNGTAIGPRRRSSTPFESATSHGRAARSSAGASRDDEQLGVLLDREPTRVRYGIASLVNAADRTPGDRAAARRARLPRARRRRARARAGASSCTGATPTQTTTSRGSSACAASDGSWWRIARSSSCSSGPGSIPSSRDEQRAAVAVHCERLGLAAGAVERAHQLCARPLPQRLALRRARAARARGSRPHRARAPRRCGATALRAAARSSRATARAANGSRDLRQRLAAPQRERVAKQARARSASGSLRARAASSSNCARSVSVRSA